MSYFISLISMVTNKLFLLFIELISSHFRDIKKTDYNNLANKKLLIIRHGGIGDLLFITPILKRIKNKNPKLKITLMTRRIYHSIFSEYPYIDKVIDHAWPNIFSLFTHDYILFLDKSIEIDPDAERLNVYDLLSQKYAKLELHHSEKRPAIFINIERRENISSMFPFNKDGKTNIGIQVRAGSPIRTPSPKFWADLILKISFQVPDSRFFLIDNGKNNVVEEIKRLVINSKTDPEIFWFGPQSRDIQDLIAFVSMMNLVIAPDSSVIHIAGGLGIPSIGIYGPFPSDLRIKYYPKCIGVDASVECAPCFTHGHKSCKKSKSCRYSPCFDSIDQHKIVENAIYLIRKYNSTNTYKFMTYRRSETSKLRDQILNVVFQTIEQDLQELNGVEIGSAGDPLIDSAICIDLPTPYTKCGNKPIHLKGDAKKLVWFADNSLDYIYSSHLFEDFEEGDNLEVLNEWVRVIKEGGYLILLLPHQQRYELYCKLLGEKPNEHHKIRDFSPEYMLNLLLITGKLEVLKIEKFWEYYQYEYNFLIIAQKVSSKT